MIYLKLDTMKRMSITEVMAVVPVGEDIANYGIVELESDYPSQYDPEIYEAPTDGGNEEFTEERTYEVPSLNVMAMDGPQTTTMTQTVSGWRIKWNIVPKAFETVCSVLVDRLSAKKKAVEDSGITLPNGMSIATKEIDRTRILHLKIAYVDNPSNPRLDNLRFKGANNVFVAMDKALILPLYTVMVDRTLDIFAREAAIQEGFYTAADAAAAIAFFQANIDVGWPSNIISSM